MPLNVSAERRVVAATMGPTIHDVHAWRFTVVPGLIEVRADQARFRPAHDPAGRGLHISCGAALVNLRLAAAQLGHDAVVRLLPDSERPTLLAAVRLAGRRHRVTRSERLLFAATLRPFAAGRPAAGSPPTLPVLNELAEAARLEGAALHTLPVTSGDGFQKAVLTTQGDSPAEWLRAGQALQRVLLSGVGRSVSASFVYDVIDVPGVRDLVQHGDVPQVVLELTASTPPASTVLPEGPERRQHERQGDSGRVG
ncbi:hypothetical protein ACGFNU_43195 [Spirillospora sp. NPDC048911]|uniref:hypothetical protein n=1 Tax=Spirillospora sp. NPDC048911 TaxID=3364527 RepID=UPI00371A8FAF